MAYTDPYVTPQEYRKRVDKKSGDSDNELESQLIAFSRLIDRACGRTFNNTGAVQTRYYDGVGGYQPTSEIFSERDYIRATRGVSSSFYIPDDIATSSGLVVAVDLDGDYTHETTLTINTHFWLEPYNAGARVEPEPYSQLRLVPNNSVITAWPVTDRGIKITAVWGWLNVPSAVKEAVVLLTREMRDLQEAGVTLTLQDMDAAIRLSPRAPNIISDIVKSYGRRSKVYFS